MNGRFVLVVGAGPRGQAFAATMEAHRELGLRVIGMLDDDPALPKVPSGRGWASWPSVSASSETTSSTRWPSCCRSASGSTPTASPTSPKRLARSCACPWTCWTIRFATGTVEELDGTPVYSLVSGPDRALALVTKRFLDIVAAARRARVLSPFLVVIAWRHPATRRWPGAVPSVARRPPRPHLPDPQVPLHGSRRGSAQVGAGGGQRDLGPVFKITHDPRITPLGRRLRRWSIDELPQLWNVLRGDMSLVGPRPPLESEVTGYDMWHRRRLSMKPGITGLWQVRNRHDPEFDHWVEDDLEYIDRWSLLLDLQILVRTIPAALEGR